MQDGGAPLAGDYPRYTAGVAMLETAERFTPVEKEPSLRELLLLIGGLRALNEAIDRARSEVLLETYIFDFAGATLRVAEALERAAARGLCVQVVVDGGDPLHEDLVVVDLDGVGDRQPEVPAADQRGPLRDRPLARGDLLAPRRLALECALVAGPPSPL